MGILRDAWENFKKIQRQDEPKRERERLEREAQKRKEEAKRLGISEILILIKEEGAHLGKPWLGDFKYDSAQLRKTIITFTLNGKPYTLTFEKHDSSYSSYSDSDRYDKEPVTATLESNGQLLYSARIYWVCSHEFPASWYVASEYAHDINAYVPGAWVQELKNFAEKVEERRKQEEFDRKHSPQALDDLRKKFGL